MSNNKFDIGNKNSRLPHDEIFGESNQPAAVNYPKTKKKKWEDNYTRATLYLQNDVLDELNRLAGTEKGEKTRIVNEALQDYFRKNR